MLAQSRPLVSPNTQPWWQPDWAAIFGLDLRSLALFRILIALVLLADLAIRATDLQAMYSAEGVYSATIAHEWLGNDWTRWSFYYFHDSATVSGWLMVVNAIAAACLLFGFQSRIAVAACWMFLISLQYRNPLSSNGGDIMLRALLFWSLFLPVGARWSIDAVWRQRLPDRNLYVSVGTFAVILQLCLVYWFTGNAKVTTYWQDGTALQYVLMFEDYGRPARHIMLTASMLLPFFTWGTLGLELFGPFLVWFPWFTRWIRLALIGAFIGFHLGIELTMTVGLFSWVSIAGWLLLLPDMVWDFRWVRERGTRESAQQRGNDSPPGELALSTPTHPSETTPLRTRSVYPTTPAKWWLWVAMNIVCLFFVVYVVSSNLGTLGDSKNKDDFWKTTFTPRDSRWIGKVMGLSQNWNMFGSPPRHIGWYIARAETTNGEEIDLLRGGATFSESPPARFSAQFANHRWRKMMRAIRPKKNERRIMKKIRQTLAEHLVNSWNRSHPPDNQVTKVVIARYSQPVSLEGKPTEKTIKHWLEYEVDPEAGEP